MEFHEKLQELRKQKNLTQEELSEILFVSRTAISKWESGRGYPSIDSLKAIAEFFGVTIDELLSNRELICIAEKDSHQKTQHMRDLVFGLIDCSVVMLFFIPLFGQQGGEIRGFQNTLNQNRSVIYNKKLKKEICQKYKHIKTA